MNFEFYSGFEKDLKKLKLDRDSIINIKEKIENIPNGDIKKIEGKKNRFRLRVGKYRILYDRVKNNVKIISIVERKNAY